MLSSTTFFLTVKVMKKNVWHTSKSFPFWQRSLVLVNGHLFVQVPKTSGILWRRNAPQGIWDHIEDKMLLEFGESGCPFIRATTPLSKGNLKRKGH